MRYCLPLAVALNGSSQLKALVLPSFINRFSMTAAGSVKDAPLIRISTVKLNHDVTEFESSSTNRVTAHQQLASVPGVPLVVSLNPISLPLVAVPVSILLT